MLSDRARQQWNGYAGALAGDTAPSVDRDRLQRFLVGLHLRGEELAAQDLHLLLDEVGLAGPDRDQLVVSIEFGLSLLATYDAMEEEDGSVYQREGISGFEL